MTQLRDRRLHERDHVRGPRNPASATMRRPTDQTAEVRQRARYPDAAKDWKTERRQRRDTAERLLLLHPLPVIAGDRRPAHAALPDAASLLQHRMIGDPCSPSTETIAASSSQRINNIGLDDAVPAERCGVDRRSGLTAHPCKPSRSAGSKFPARSAGQDSRAHASGGKHDREVRLPKRVMPGSFRSEIA